MEDCAEYVELYGAAAKAGLVMVPINARFMPKEAEHQLADSGARLLVATPALHERVSAVNEAAGLPLISTQPAGELDAERFDDVVGAGSPERPPAPPGDALYILGYTSGTTGVPKGAMLTHRSVLAIARMNAISYRLPAFSTAALTGSMSFVATVPAHIVSHLYVGGTVIVMGPWTVEELFETMASERVTFTYVPSPLIAEFTAAAAAAPRSWASLESLLHSASRAEPDKLRALCDVVGDRFVEGLGMTENSGGLITATTAADIRGESRADDLFASVGRAAVEALVDVVDEEGNALPHDGQSVGEIVMRSPALMDGYWNLPEATAAALRDGWYHSGDLGSLDAAGYLYVADRRTDLIVSGGMNVYPSEVERCIAAMPGVVECAVVGVPHPRWGQTVVAAVVKADDAVLTDADVVAGCSAEMAGYTKPTSVVFMDSLPRTASLKVKRGEVRALVEQVMS
jgi:acyl-CoA synthetase (AMP-forming)/AMP-acid ligase II